MKPPSVAKPPGMPAVGPLPAAVKPEAKKETAKVASGIAMKPQATVKLQPRPQASQSTSSSFTVKSTEIVPTTETTEEEIPMNLSIAALAAAVLALVFQIWTMLG
jgi:hypothetical protein